VIMMAGVDLMMCSKACQQRFDRGLRCVVCDDAYHPTWKR